MAQKYEYFFKHLCYRLKNLMESRLFNTFPRLLPAKVRFCKANYSHFSLFTLSGITKGNPFMEGTVRF